MRIVLDTNSILVTLSKKSPYRPIFDAIIDNKLTLLVSNEILMEYAEIIEKRASIIVSTNVTEFLVQAKSVEKIEIYYKWHLIEKDVDDNKFVDCAVSGNADYLVTDDKHFSQLYKVNFPAVKVIKTKDFLKLLINSKN
ncbi:MAG: putative toxin-antitoxin system toxin component, PIN family [Saprospiraceae bacterium]